MNNNFYDIYKNFMNSVSVLEEARTDDAKAFLDKSNTKYSPEDFQYLVDNEPTRNNSPAYKYILWMARSLKEGVPAKTIVNYINVYHNSLNKLPVQYRNIDAFKSFQDLKSLIDPMVQDVEDEQNKLSAEDVISFDSQKDNFYVTHEDKQSIVLRILTTQAACDLAQPVRGNWCLAGQGKGWSEDSIRMFYTYLGPHSASYTRMYFVYKKATPSDRSTNTVTLEIDGVKRTVVSDTTFAVLARQEKGNIEYSCFNRFDQTVSIETVANIFSNIKSIVDRDFKNYKASTVSRSDEIISKFNEIINANDSQTFEMFLSYYMSSLNNKEFIKFIEDVLVNVFASMPKNWQQLQMVQKIKKNFPSYFIEIKNIDDLLPQNIVNSIKRGFINDSVLRYHLNFTNTIVNMVNQNNTNIDYIKEKFANLMYEFRDGFNNAERYRILINNLNTIQTGTNQYENLKLFYLFFPLCNGQKMPFGIDFTFSDTHKKELREVLVEELPKQENLKKLFIKKLLPIVLQESWCLLMLILHILALLIY